MIIGKVVGTVVATRKEDVLVGMKFLAVVPLDLKTGALKDGGVVAVDAVASVATAAATSAAFMFRPSPQEEVARVCRTSEA